ncbi:replicative DNA helicase [Ligilactobacillus equi]|uniref:replicative DNA helicase n=1 Tax=Ligilactobacillus equi TaxID=137357 RepID=UPI002ED32D5F
MNNESVEASLQEGLPPQNIEAEQSVLGSIIIDNDTLADAQEYLEAQDFYRSAHKQIFQAFVDLNDRDEPLDPLTVANYLAEQNQLEDVGGPSYLAELAGIVPSASNVANYAKIVSEKSTSRKLIAAARDIISRTQNQDGDIQSLVDKAEQDIMRISENRTTSGFLKIKDIIAESYQNIADLSQRKETITGLGTGFADFDRMTAGLQPDNLIILAARPAVGKTAFVLNIAQNVGLATDKTVAIFSLEMGAESLVNRMLCAEGMIDAGHMRTGNLTDEEWQHLMMASGSLSRTSIFIDDTPGIKVSEIRAKCRRLAKETKNLGLIVIDYLQLIEGSNKESRQQEVSEISRQLKKLAKELNVPVIALSQLSRGVEQRQDKRPVLSDIRESGSIEQDADIVAFLYRDDYYEREGSQDGNDDGSGMPIPGMPDSDSSSSPVELIIEKNRGGARGTVNLLFMKSYNKFSSLSLRDDQ